MSDQTVSGETDGQESGASVHRHAAAGRGITRQDRVLIEGILAGRSESFDALYSRYERRIYYYALKRLGNPFDAEDVTQEVFFQVLRGLDKFEGRSALLTWMFGIAHNQVCRRFRKRGPERISLDSDELRGVSDGSPPADQRVDFVRVLRNCSRVVEEKVTAQQQQAFELRYLRNYSTKQIAEEMGKSTQAIKISLHRTRRTLADCNRDLQTLLMTA